MSAANSSASSSIAPHRSWLPRTLANRLTALYALVFILCLALSFALLYVSVRTVFDIGIEGDLEDDVELLRDGWARDGDAAIDAEIAREIAEGDVDELFIVLLDGQGRQLLATDLSDWDNIRVEPFVAQAILDSGEPRMATRKFDTRDADALTILAPIGENRLVWLAESFEERDDVMELLLAAFALTFALAVPAASAFVWLASRRAARGIEAVSAAAVAIRDGDLDRRAHAHGGVTEVRNLASAFNAMADRNRKLIGDMRDMTDNIAHDLRSPLTRVRIIAESSLQDPSDAGAGARAANDIVHECDRLTQMIDVALDVSEAEAGVTRVRHAPVEMSSLACDVVELFEPAAEEQGMTIVCHAAHGLFIAGDRTALERVCVNLVDNAIKFSPPGGNVIVDVRRNGELVELCVTDRGIGIAPEEIERVFDRYYRADDSRSSSGSGLGLSYVRAVVRLHGGDIVASSVSGAGTRFLVTLPRLEHGDSAPESCEGGPSTARRPVTPA